MGVQINDCSRFIVAGNLSFLTVLMEYAMVCMMETSAIYATTIDTEDLVHIVSDGVLLTELGVYLMCGSGNQMK